jgi:hypothetical protein
LRRDVEHSCGPFDAQAGKEAKLDYLGLASIDLASDCKALSNSASWESRSGETTRLVPNLQTLGGPRGQRLPAIWAWCEVRAHIAPGKLGAATPTAFHPRPSWAPDEIECRVLLMLPYTNRTPALATAPRHTITAERQYRAVALRKVNILAAAPTYRHVSGTGVIEQPVFARGSLQRFHFAAGLERKLAFPWRRRAPGSIGGGRRGVGVRAIWRA